MGGCYGWLLWVDAEQYLRFDGMPVAAFRCCVDQASTVMLALIAEKLVATIEPIQVTRRRLSPPTIHPTTAHSPLTHRSPPPTHHCQPTIHLSHTITHSPATTSHHHSLTTIYPLRPPSLTTPRHSPTTHRPTTHHQPPTTHLSRRRTGSARS